MEKNKKLEEILSELKNNWKNENSVPNDKIEKELKKVVNLHVSNFIDSIEDYENILKFSFRDRIYKSLTEEEKKEIERQYNTKLDQIKRFFGSLAGVIAKKHIYERSEISMRMIADALEKENYFEILGKMIRDYAFTWIDPLCNYYYTEISKKTPITYNDLQTAIVTKINCDKTIDEWSKYFQNEDFDGLAKWVEKFTELINSEMIEKSKIEAEKLKEKVNPKFYFIKETKDGCAVVYSEEGQLYVFQKGKSPILYPEKSNENSQDFKRIRATNPTAFPEFHPGKW